MQVQCINALPLLPLLLLLLLFACIALATFPAHHRASYAIS
jgi:hypothetical protein